MRKITSMLLAVMLVMSCFNVFAEVAVDDASSTVTLSGTLDSGEEGVLIGIDVFCPDMGYEDLSKVSYGEYKKVVVLRKQIVSGESGKWETEFEIYDDPNLDYDAQSGTYTAVIFPEGYSQAVIEKFAYLNLKAAEKLIDEIMQTGTQASVEAMLETQAANLGLSYDFVTKLDAEKTAALIIDAKDSARLSNTELIDNINAIRSAAIIEAVSEGLISELFEYSDVLGLSKTAMADYYNKEYVKENYSAITGALKGGSYDSYSSFIEALCEQTVLQVVKNPDGIGNIKEIVKLFEGRTDWTGNYSDSAYLSVQGGTYDSYEKLKAALDSAGSESNGGGSGGSSGGGGMASGSGLSPVSGGATFVTETDESLNGVMEYNIFDDIADISWAKDAIIHLAQLGIVNGKTETKFYPNDTITREELAKILVLTFAEDSAETEVTFKDAEPSAWYYPYIARAVSAGIVNGYSKDEFGVGRPVTRQEMCTMIYRAASSSGITLEPEQVSFADEAEIADYAKDAVGALAAKGIVVGSDLNNFAPADEATRAQVAKIVYRLIMQ